MTKSSRPAIRPLSEFDVDSFIQKHNNNKQKELSSSSTMEETEQESRRQPLQLQPAFEPVRCSDPMAVTFSESKSYDVDEMTVDTNQAEGLDTVPSLDDGFRQFKVECDSPMSGNNSSCSSVTARTRIETMDSANNDIDYGFNTDHRDPLPPTSQKPMVEPDQQSPSLGLMQFARRIHKEWAGITKKFRGAMLYVVVEVSVKAAKYPRATIGCIALVSFALVVLGFFTNFHVRLDNETMFTPTSSEVIEFNEYFSDISMYEDAEADRRRKLRQARALKKLREERKLVTISIFGEEDLHSYDGSYSTLIYNESTSPSMAPSSLPAGEREDKTNATLIVDTSTADIDLEVVDPTDSPESEVPADPTLESEATAEDEEENYHERGHGALFPILAHADTANVFTIEGVNKVFDVLDYLKAIPEYSSSCHGDEASFHNYYGENTCEISAITRFWNHNRTLFQQQVKKEEDLFDAANAIFYPDGGYADLPFVLAKSEEDEHGRPVRGEAFPIMIFSKDNQAYRAMTDNLLKLQSKWKGDSSHYFVLEFVSPESFEQEVQRAILGDLPLIPTVFVVMCIFTCLVFFKWHKVHSRSLLGVGAVVTIVMSILSGWGILFTAGVPMTAMTNLLVFVIFGIGLDDTFIITGAYFRTDHKEDPVVRVRHTMESVGSSIILTTVTTSVAFILGSTSTVLPIRWLCLYAFPAVIIDFIYQVTFFIAILVLDERRIQSNRMDCCICVRVPDVEESDKDDEVSIRATPDDHERILFDGEESMSFNFCETTKEPEAPKKCEGEPSDHIADRFMRWFASCLMLPYVKVLVMAVFVVFAAVCAYNTSKLRQQFNFKDLLPKDSYAASYVTAIEYYSNRAIAVKVVFRFVEQEDEDVRNQMERYVKELVENVDALNEQPPFFWVREFRAAVAAEASLQGLPFQEQLRILLENPAVNDAIGKEISFRPDGTIMQSQVKLYVTDLDMDNVKDQIEFFRQQREVTIRQPVNEGQELWKFFSYDMLFNIFAFYEVAAGELATTTVASVVAVCIIAFLLIPHWSAVPIILPLLSALYIEMLGVLQMFGYSINVVTYVILVVSIGLLVDFIMHILLRYYESECDTREEKVKDALGTMGASILVGGMSTFLGVTPLIFSASEIFSTVCLAFLAMVFLGVTHGLIVLPVLLSYFGTEQVVRHRKRLSLVQITHAMSERFHQSMEFVHSRHHMSLENCRSKSQESEVHV